MPVVVISAALLLYLETVHGIVAQRFADAHQLLSVDWSFTNINLASVPVSSALCWGPC